MRYRTFGTSGLRVSELFPGAMTFGEQGGVGAPPQECRRILDAYADAGGNVIDTAINYRGGASEEIVGELLAGRRDRFVLATKHTVSRDRDDPNAVAIAWTRKRSPAIHPIIGARRLDQLLDNLGATDVDLGDHDAARLDAAAGIDLGFPATFIRETSPWVFGAASLPGN
jgi:aryl-alcohol dehydrogenase-like predicted oxidoreductase